MASPKGRSFPLKLRDRSATYTFCEAKGLYRWELSPEFLLVYYASGKIVLFQKTCIANNPQESGRERLIKQRKSLFYWQQRHLIGELLIEAVNSLGEDGFDMVKLPPANS